MESHARHETYVQGFVRRLRELWEQEQGFEAEAPSTDEVADAPAPPHPAPPESIGEPDTGSSDGIDRDLLGLLREQARAAGWPEEIIAELYRDPSPAGPGSGGQGALQRMLEGARATADQLGLPLDGLEAAMGGVDGEPFAPPSAATSSDPRASAPAGFWNAQQLRELVSSRLAAGEPLRDLMLIEADLSLLDLSEQDLSGSLLLRADLSGATLDRAILEGATLDEARIEGASFRQARLAGAMLALVEGEAVDLREADVREASFERALLPGARFEQAQASGAVFTEAYLVGARFERADLSESEMAGANLDEARFDGARLTDARLERASLRLASLDQVEAEGLRASDGADLSEARVRWSNLAGGVFSNAILVGTKFTESTLTRATFAGSRLEGGELLAVSARGASFAEASLVAASLAGSDLLGARFEAANLRLSNLTHANLYQAEFWRADVTDARLEGANIEGTKLQ